jgi:hypothetical protein
MYEIPVDMILTFSASLLGAYAAVWTVRKAVKTLNRS